MHRYILGVYDLFERLISKFPKYFLNLVQEGEIDLTQECYIMHLKDG